MWISMIVSIVLLMSMISIYLEENPLEWVRIWSNYFQYLPTLFRI